MGVVAPTFSPTFSEKYAIGELNPDNRASVAFFGVLPLQPLIDPNVLIDPNWLAIT